MKKIILAVVMCFAVNAMAASAMTLNPDVTQKTIATTICVPYWTDKVRPSTSYTNSIKLKLMAAQGIDPSRIKEFELDHEVPLDLGGSPRSPANLILQPWNGTDGAHTKDVLEVRLKKKVCNGEIKLITAQRCIYKDWQACAKKYPK